MPNYTALIYNPKSDGPPSDELMATIMTEYKAFHEIAGQFIRAGEWLQGVHTATTVQTAGKGGKVTMTDGPFAETKEVLGGFYVFECDDLDQALKLAGQIPASFMGGRVEVRPNHEHV